MGSVLYVRRALGQGGQPIDVFKIRTMCEDADVRLEHVLMNGRDSLGKIVQDPRITPIGKVLRRYWIDEMPQIYNLARGDLKLVGIRPMTEEAWRRDFPVELMERALRQKPGLMGIEYAFPLSPCFDQKAERLEDYLSQWEGDPEGTDRAYFERILHNVFINGVRSS